MSEPRKNGLLKHRLVLIAIVAAALVIIGSIGYALLTSPEPKIMAPGPHHSQSQEPQEHI